MRRATSLGACAEAGREPVGPGVSVMPTRAQTTRDGFCAGAAMKISPRSGPVLYCAVEGRIWIAAVPEIQEAIRLASAAPYSSPEITPFPSVYSTGQNL